MGTAAGRSPARVAGAGGMNRIASGTPLFGVLVPGW